MRQGRRQVSYIAGAYETFFLLKYLYEAVATDSVSMTPSVSSYISSGLSSLGVICGGGAGIWGEGRGEGEGDGKEGREEKESKK